MISAAGPRSNGIGTLNEKPLHASLKAWYAEDGDAFEVPVDGFVVDIVRDRLLIEIQTSAVGPIRSKLTHLVKHHPVRLILPISVRKTIVHVDEAGSETSGRLSNKRGALLDAFLELVSLPHLLADPNFGVEVVLLHVAEIRKARTSPKRRRRQKDWEVHERRLIEIVDHALLDHPGDFLAVLPRTMEDPFTTADLARELGRPRWLAQKIAYCLREMGTIVAVGRSKRGIEYRRGYSA